MHCDTDTLACLELRDRKWVDQSSRQNTSSLTSDFARNAESDPAQQDLDRLTNALDDPPRSGVRREQTEKRAIIDAKYRLFAKQTEGKEHGRLWLHVLNSSCLQTIVYAVLWGIAITFKTFRR